MKINQYVKKNGVFINYGVFQISSFLFAGDRIFCQNETSFRSGKIEDEIVYLDKNYIEVYDDNTLIFRYNPESKMIYIKALDPKYVEFKLEVE